MARTNSKNEFSGNFLMVKTFTQNENKEPTDPHFAVLNKNEEGKYKVKGDAFDRISGDIKNISVDKFEYEGNVSYSARILLEDKADNESCLLDLKFNILNRTILNSLMGLTSLDGVSISLYKNKKGYATASVKQGEEGVGWKFGWDEIPKATVITHPKTGKVIQSDFSEVDEFYAEKLEAWASELGIWKTSSKPEEKSVVESDETSSHVESEDADELDSGW